MAGALRGVRVLEFGQYVAGPLLGMLLADQGADVVKVEPPGGEPGRRVDDFEVWNRGKRSLVANLNDPADRSRLLALGDGADVVIEGFRPGVADRLGIGAETMRASNPRLIYCSLPGFGAESPYRNVPAWEGIIGARTGIYRPTAQSKEPVYIDFPVNSTFAAIVAAAGVAGALAARIRDDEGQTLEIPLHAATFAAMGVALLRREEPPPTVASSPGPRPLVRSYRCADGRYLQFHVGVEKFAHDFFTLINEPELLGLALRQKSTGDELAFEALAKFDELILTRPAAEWEELCIRAKVPGVLCRTREEWLAHPHAEPSGAIIPVESPRLGPTRQPGIAVRLLGTPGEVTGGAPALGDGGAIGWTVPWLGDEAQQVSPDRKKDAQPLSGVRVLDLTVFLAGPTCGRTLAEFGADVIKIDDPNRTISAAFTGNPDSIRMDADRGKRSILLDLKTEAGREVFWRLIERTDVLVENFRPGAFERLGVGYEEVAKRKPGIIYASLSAYGQQGPWSPRPGFEITTQAVTGTQVRYGGPDGAPVGLPLAPNDYGTGILGAFAVMLALIERTRTGRGQHIDAALMYTACTMQSGLLLDYPGRILRDVEGQQARGPSARSRLYEASDGWLYLHLAENSEVARLLALEPFAKAPEPSDDNQLAAMIEETFRKRPLVEWLNLLAAADLTAVPNATAAEFHSDPAFMESGVLVSRDHPGYGRLTHLGTIFRLGRTPTTPGRPVEPLGWSTDEILAESRYSAGEIAALRDAEVVR